MHSQFSSAPNSSYAYSRRANNENLKPTNKIFGPDAVDEPESEPERPIALQDNNWQWNKGLAHAFINHWSYMNLYLILSIGTAAVVGYLLWEVRKLQVVLQDTIDLGGNSPAAIIRELDDGFRQLRSELTAEITVFNADLTADVQKEISNIKAFTGRKTTETKEQLSFLDSRLSKLHISVRKLIQTTKEQTIIGAHCKQAENGLDEYDEDLENGNPFASG